MEWFAYLFVFIIAVSLALAVYYSMASRTQGDPLIFRFLQSKYNISAGIGLLLIGISQLAHSDFTWIRLGIGVLFLLIGGANVIMGWKRYKHYRVQVREAGEK